MRSGELRAIGIVLALLLLGVAVTLSRGGDRPPARGAVSERGPLERESKGESGVEVEGESEEWIPAGIASIDQVLDAKERPTSTSVQPSRSAAAERPATGPLCPTPCLVNGFATHNNVSDYTPADPAGAAGDNHVVATVNTSMGIWDRSGTVEVAPTLLDNLFPNTRAYIFDPKVVYDQYNGTYVLVFLGDDEPRSWIFTVAIPDATATDKSTWCKRRIGGDQLGDGIPQSADYPGLGYDGDRIYITSNLFGYDDRFYGTQILAFPNKSLYDCGGRVRKTVFVGKKTLDPDGGRSASIQPAITGGTTLPSAEYMTSFDYSCNFTCKGDTMVLWRVRDVGGRLRLGKAGVDVGTAVMPQFGTQKGASSVNQKNLQWDTGDLRVTNTFYDPDLDRIYTAHSVDHNYGTADYREATARWYEIAPAGTLTASANTRSGYVGSTGLDMGWPAVATSADGTLFMTVSGAGYPADQYLSVYATTIPPSTTTPDALVQFHAGTGAYNWGSGQERWGDYNQINRDPLDGSMMWTFNQTATSFYNFKEYVDRINDI